MARPFRSYSKFLILALSVSGLLLYSHPAKALEIKDATVEVRNDFVLEPAKTEISVKPGDKITKTLSIVNRTDSEKLFSIDVEDFKGSQDPKQVVVLLGSDKGPYSLKDFIKPEVKTFKLKSKQRANINIQFSIPLDAEPGGLYGSVLVSSSSEGTGGQDLTDAKTVSRLGALYFVRVAGNVKEDAHLADFRMEDGKSVYEKGPYNFEALFENNSSVHLTPSGKVIIKNIIGKKVAELDVTPFFSLPDSLRAAQISWDDSGFAFGRYTVTINLNRGYKSSPDVVDSKTIVFWILPWKILVAIVIAILLVALLLRIILRSFEIRRRK
jgi:hypothetical protein